MTRRQFHGQAGFPSARTHGAGDAAFVDGALGTIVSAVCGIARVAVRGTGTVRGICDWRQARQADETL
jgi:hypothetical protein